MKPKKKINAECQECAVATSTERISPRKLNLVAAMIRGMSSQEAVQRLQFLKVRSAPIVSKALRSAIANAAHNKGIVEDTVILKAEIGSKGRLKRFRPGSHGRASPILRRFAQVRIVLGIKKPS